MTFADFGSFSKVNVYKEIGKRLAEKAIELIKKKRKIVSAYYPGIFASPIHVNL